MIAHIKFCDLANCSMLCAGITTYSPLKHWNIGPGKKVGIVGIAEFVEGRQYLILFNFSRMKHKDKPYHAIRFLPCEDRSDKLHNIKFQFQHRVVWVFFSLRLTVSSQRLTLLFQMLSHFVYESGLLLLLLFLLFPC
jgi:hypothetical protein